MKVAVPEKLLRDTAALAPYFAASYDYVGTLKPKAVVKDVGRVLGFTPQETDALAKLIPNAPNFSLTVKEAIEQIPEVKKLYGSDGRYRQLLDYASALEAWRGAAQRTVDDAEMKFVIVHLHKLLDPSAAE